MIFYAALQTLIPTALVANKGDDTDYSSSFATRLPERCDGIASWTIFYAALQTQIPTALVANKGDTDDSSSFATRMLEIGDCIASLTFFMQRYKR
jgi:hypothetical protein